MRCHRWCKCCGSMTVACWLPLAELSPMNGKFTKPHWVLLQLIRRCSQPTSQPQNVWKKTSPRLPHQKSGNGVAVWAGKDWTRDILLMQHECTDIVWHPAVLPISYNLILQNNGALPHDARIWPWVLEAENITVLVRSIYLPDMPASEHVYDLEWSTCPLVCSRNGWINILKITSNNLINSMLYEAVYWTMRDTYHPAWH